MSRRLVALLRLPLDDYVAALDVLLRGRPLAGAAVALLAALACWWVYLPLHELLHALGCLAGGGTVTRLEIDAIYGAAWLQRVFPFVVVGSAYAGQLTGFDTGGSDLTYLLTDFLPYALTILLGVPLLRAAARRPPGLPQAALFGAALPLALIPFGALSGDFYEMGSIIVSRLAAPLLPAQPLDRWRSDDLFLLVDSLPAGTADVVGLTLSLLLGTALAFLTYAAGAAWAEWLRRWRGAR